VLEARAIPTGDGTYRFDVTVRHADTGWDHYADAWEILAPDGAVLGIRTLLHPHVDEQPFTRSLTGVRDSRRGRGGTVRAHDSVHGYGDREVVVAREWLLADCRSGARRQRPHPDHRGPLVISRLYVMSCTKPHAVASRWSS
jgi:hypothetical protein